MTAQSLQKQLPYSFTPTPSWVDLTSLADALKLDASHIVDVDEARFLMLLLDSSLFLQSDGISTFHYHYIQKYQSSNAVRDNSEFEIDYLPHYQHVEIHRINVIRNGETIDKINTSHFVLNDTVRHHEDLIHTGYGQLKILINDIQVGDILDIDYSVIGPRTPLHDQFSTAMSLGFGFPLLRRRMSVYLPNDKKLYWKSHGGDCQPIRTTKPEIQTHDIYVFETQPLLIDCQEDSIPPSFPVVPYVEVTDASTWREIYNVVKERYEPQQPTQDKLVSVLAKIESEAENLEDKIIASINYVQNQIRYQVCSEPLHSVHPFNLSQIVNNGFGDCKDKSLMLVSLLTHFGVEAYPALVNTDCPSDPSVRLPSTAAFNHVIVVIYLDGKRYWVDATVSFEEGRLDFRGISVSGFALILNDKDADDVTAIDKDRYTSREVHDVFDISGGDKEPIKFSTSCIYRGTWANSVRARHARDTKKEIAKSYTEFYQRDWSALKSLSELEIEDDKVTNTVIEREYYEIPSIDTFPMNDNFHWIKAKSVVSCFDWPKEGKDRRYPFALGYPQKLTQRIDILYPWDVLGDMKDSVHSVEDDAFKLIKRITHKGRCETNEYTFETLTSSVSPESIEAYLKNIDEAYEIMSIPVPWNWVNLDWCRKNLPKNLFLRGLVKVKNGIREYFGWPFWIGLWLVFVLMKWGVRYFGS